MNHQPQHHLPKETSLERIFRTVIGRKLIQMERTGFHLKAAVKPLKRKPV